MVDGHLPLKTLAMKTTSYGSEELVGGSIVCTFARAYKCVEEESMNSKIKTEREKAGMSRYRLAAETGLSYNCLLKWEKKGTSKARAGSLLKAARAIGVPVEDLIDEEE